MKIVKVTLTVDGKTASAYLKQEGHGALMRIRDIDEKDRKFATRYETDAEAQSAYNEYAKTWRNPPAMTIEDLAHETQTSVDKDQPSDAERSGDVGGRWRSSWWMTSLGA